MAFQYDGEFPIFRIDAFDRLAKNLCIYSLFAITFIQYKTYKAKVFQPDQFFRVAFLRNFLADQQDPNILFKISDCPAALLIRFACQSLQAVWYPGLLK